ncbi:MAG: Asp-tRNA(Asn)/Glu-tRNA(Gln) amidotransferase GatCAB subunit B [Nitrospirae bacterium CG18_big_fil_WC_8_21_14_2_50_70_55]|nr:Asp-tRNA(Asn)/Glu-tRNA(Gln) amidotransferase subunit GatB [Deltaproteobacteria bacterium]OIP65937.1 MAG: aspartyl/glutamyl-tRNA amidotransferase subunit B [Nitrospirae bacterium CG2_30_70_394]PIQ03603.1 MAG: Asp-tRNA(Asn)/Glu-tRNA(Gln) amidotransferase GatCAB subunit B [Nitrospirae bacterium CG18_big_fil_WC_8_21_14_2_50_70_55]PIU79316.1 MAG: Asp-tRNA(Asn)/Glu-tRNA(Gln) amidotransferase GatCAB subunit B [Nitrospirae bacterium CG06_land_8_20_14_3_00_70_43]PIW83370.1 MAG: Asp-tRNA(Asn)/Glu-tRNA
MEFETVIGLEVHTQLMTQSKIFCGCSTTFGAPPNSHTCPVCLGMPGVLPVLNREVVSCAIKLGLATHCTINRSSRWARKNYFYPDLPKAYQISQYEAPICEHGYVEAELESGEVKRIRLTRIHMEEDAGKNIHGEGDDDHSYVDLNRAGVPLLEIVSEPDLRSAEEATAYLKRLRSIVRYLGISDGNMEEGSFRCDANVSIRPRGSATFGTRAEVKNLNSFRHVGHAIDYEVRRQARLLAQGQAVVQETRLWNPTEAKTFSMRSKEEAHDYRYFPDPDLLPLVVDEGWIERIRATLPELPAEKEQRFVRDYGLPAQDTGVLVASQALADYFEQVAGGVKEAKTAANWVLGDLLGVLNKLGTSVEESPVDAAALAALIRLIEEGTISGKIAKSVFEKMVATHQPAAEIVAAEGLVQVADPEQLRPILQQIFADNPTQLADYRAGKTKLMGFFVGQAMRVTGGKANPALVNDLLREMLGPVEE